MKKHFLVLLVLVFSGIGAAAQTGTLSANLYGGYTFKERVNFDAAYTDVQDGFQWGVGLEYFTSYRTSVELKYMRMDTRFPLFGPQGNQLNSGNDDGSLQYILLGGNQYFPQTGSAIAPFIGGSLGIGIVDGEANNATKFAWGMPRRGSKYKQSRSFLLKFMHISNRSFPLLDQIIGRPAWGSLPCPTMLRSFSLVLEGPFALISTNGNSTGSRDLT